MEQIIAWVLLVVTSVSMLAKKEGLVFGVLFIASTVIGFMAFGFLRGLGYLVLLLMGAVLFHVLERFLSMRIAGKMVKEELRQKWQKEDSSS